MKPTDKAIRGMVSESLGRNMSEPSGGLDRKLISRRPSPLWWGEGSITGRRLTDAACHSGGVVGGSTVTRACPATGETVLVPALTCFATPQTGNATAGPGFTYFLYFDNGNGAGST